MLKNYLFVTLMAVSTACAEKHESNVPAPEPTPVPLVNPVDGDVILTETVMETRELPEDFGFTATYAKFGRDYIRFQEGETVVKVRKNRVQLRNQGDREILDCVLNETPLPTIHYIVEGKAHRLDTLMGITCTNMLYLAKPITNLDELCKAYGCVDERVGDFDTTKVLMDEPLWIEKETKIRIQSGDGLQMIKKISEAPSVADFQYIVNP